MPTIQKNIVYKKNKLHL